MRALAGYAIASTLLLAAPPADAAAPAPADEAAPAVYHRLAGAEPGKSIRHLKPAPLRPLAVQAPIFGLHAHYDADGKLSMQCDLIREARALGDQHEHIQQEQQ